MYKLSLVPVRTIASFILHLDASWTLIGQQHAAATFHPGQETFIFYIKENENYQLGTGFSVHHRLLSEVNRAEFVGGRMSLVI
jgi:hypothetical protein